MDSALDELLLKSEATGAWLIDKGGPLITQRGALEEFDATTIAALAAGSFAATEAMAGLIGEVNFTSVYQQGERQSLLIQNVGEHLLLIVVFAATMSAGVAKYFSAATVPRITEQLEKARERKPDESLDLVSLNISNTAELFRKKA
ncbi:MAG: roadblock/LC7 domain-containing protein [Verrucomicrobiota bacterium]